MVDLIRNVWPNASQWQMLVATFGVYLLAIGGFGLCYYRLYRSRHDRFLFASEIAASQAKNVSARAQTAVRIFTREIEAMQEVRDGVKSGALSSTPGSLPNGYRVETRTYAIQSGSGESQDRLCLTVTDADGFVLCDVEGPQDDELSQAYFASWLDHMLAVWNARRDHWQKRTAEVERDPGSSWGVLDFLYFSAITQTTVGYGDILPNSTAIRLLVVVQILVAYTLLVVILNLVLVG